MGTRDFKDAGALLPPRVRTRRFWVIALSTFIFLSIVYAPYIWGGGQEAQKLAVEEWKAAHPEAAEASAKQHSPEPTQRVIHDNVPEGPGVDLHGRPTPHYRKLYSQTSPEGKYWLIWYGGEAAYNPNLIPHPTEADRWIVVAQHERSDEITVFMQEFYCTAGFLLDKLVCSDSPTVVPVTPGITGHCDGTNAWFSAPNGPRDARLFYGPEVPYLAYGSQSAHTCLGVWAHQAHTLLPPFAALPQPSDAHHFKEATELQRPLPWHEFEKNFFLFWDSQGKVYVHNDIYPKRVFASIASSGDVGENLAPLAAANDDRCIAAYMPKVAHGPDDHEGIHQATNSLTITMCARNDTTCTPSDTNTFIMHIFHWKAMHEFHGVYEPYIILFKRSSPFEIYAIGQRPFWIHGRGPLTQESGNPRYAKQPETLPPGHTEQFYVTSFSWKNAGQKYHGYADDPMFLTFGVEDGKSGVIDVSAGDLLHDLRVCEYAPEGSLERQQQEAEKTATMGEGQTQQQQQQPPAPPAVPGIVPVAAPAPAALPPAAAAAPIPQAMPPAAAPAVMPGTAPEAVPAVAFPPAAAPA